MKSLLIMRWKNQEIGTGCGLRFTIIKNIMATYLLYSKFCQNSFHRCLNQFFLEFCQMMKKKIFIIVDFKVS